ncbi:Uracil catabolism protein 4 [Cytospora mali]|uniref:Uracil catabolism protein 4 n=1 Tax=Cytospora mali TaxID=578113 RepID=A0A194UM13_CYTMA|nr:Uracil catabolism protein 4 [Valsa mali var. pyri (nom. inval.)]
MGLFSRKDKSSKGISSKPSLTTVQSQVSIESGSSSIKSPSGTFTSRALNRSSAGTNHTSAPQTPLTPFSPQVPKIDLPKPPDPDLDPAGYLKSLGSVRERSRVITSKALKNELNHFDVDMQKFPEVVSFVASIIKRDYDAPFTSIPAHGRHQHFCVGGRDRIAHLLSTWENLDTTEKCRRMIDLFLVSVLLDAGAGTQWSYKSTENGRIYKRSEGIAVASLEMFKTGVFSGDKSNKFQVDKEGLRTITVETMAKGLQSREGNEMAGLEGRTQLLVKLSDALDANKEFFGNDGRPGNMLDYLLAHPSTQASSMPIVPLPTLWNLLMSGLAPIWPQSRTAINGISLGDAWPCSSMPQPATSPTGAAPSFSPFPNTSTRSGPAAAWESILPFHKLTQWLTYSLMQPMQQLMKIHFAGQELLTGLPEYRNGGLFVDLGVMTLKPEDMERGLHNYKEYCLRTGDKGIEVAPMFEPSDDAVVEWRGVTVGLLDRLCVDVNQSLKHELAGHELSLAQVLEAGSWKGGREIAEINRPNTKEPPILIDSDGTVF